MSFNQPVAGKQPTNSTNQSIKRFNLSAFSGDSAGGDSGLGRPAHNAIILSILLILSDNKQVRTNQKSNFELSNVIRFFRMLNPGNPVHPQKNRQPQLDVSGILLYTNIRRLNGPLQIMHSGQVS